MAQRDSYLAKCGKIPLMAISGLDDHSQVWCKLEYLNPSGSIKDRIAHTILSKALNRGELAVGGAVIEASSGSTSIAMALACAQLGLQFTAIMPAGVSSERVLMIKAYGGQVELTARDQGILGAIAIARERSATGTAFWPRQFSNPDNVATHRHATAREICDQIPGGHVDAVVSGVGTGGTLVGLYHGVCDHGCTAVPVAARPINGNSLGDVECCSFSARVPGVVDGLSELYRPDYLPGLIELAVDDELAIQTTRELIAQGYPVGPSSGLNLAAARQLQASDPERYQHVVTVFPDRMERYFSTELFAPWR